MESLGAFEYTRKVMEQMVKQIREEITQFGGNEQLMQLLEFLANSQH